MSLSEEFQGHRSLRAVSLIDTALLMSDFLPSDELQEVIVASNKPLRHKRGFSEGKSKSPGRRLSRGSTDVDTVDDRPLLEHAVSEPPSRSQVYCTELFLMSFYSYKQESTGSGCNWSLTRSNCILRMNYILLWYASCIHKCLTQKSKYFSLHSFTAQTSNRSHPLTAGQGLCKRLAFRSAVLRAQSQIVFLPFQQIEAQFGKVKKGHWVSSREQWWAGWLLSR